ncbi:MAG: hypothetical protein ACOYOV_14310 [Bacteroidales bacterium]
MVDCELLTGNIGTCDDKPFLGFTKRFIIGNLSEVNTITYSATPNIVTGITLKDSKHAYSLTVKSNKPFDEYKVVGVDGKVGMTFKSDLTLWIKGLNPTTSAILKILSGGSFWGTLEQKGDSVEGTFPLLGIQGGLQASAAEWNEAEGAYSVVLTEEKGDEASWFWYNTNVATTRAAIEGLLSA